MHVTALMPPSRRAAQADAERAVAFTRDTCGGALHILVNCAAGNFLALPEGAAPRRRREWRRAAQPRRRFWPRAATLAPR